MKTIDHKKELKDLYSARKNRPTIVDVPEMQFLKFDGDGNPENSPLMQAGFQGLFSVAYTIRFAIKAQDDVAYTVMPPEGLFWSDATGLDLEDMKNWQWTLMIMQPDFVTAADVENARQQALEKGNEPAARVRLEPYDEGLAAQVMHVGPYSEEAPTIQLLHDFIAAEGYERRGIHHEIYLGDPRRAKPENLRTIIRQPIGE